jgi:hypothetical protein
MPGFRMRRIGVAAVAATALAAFAAVPEIAGVSTWKIVLGVIGVLLFVSAGRPGKRK